MQQLKVSKLPLYLQAQKFLLNLIENGTYQPGEQLPSEAALSAQLGISRPTLREALLNLEQEGIVIRKHGVGTFVAPGYGHRLESGLERLESILEMAGRQGLQLYFDALQVQNKPAAAELAEKLQIAPDTLVTHIDRVIQAGGKPVACMLDLVIPSVLAPEDVDETFNGSVLDLLRQQQGQQIGQALADIVALNADADLAERLGIKIGQAVLLIEETLFDKEGVVVGFSRNYFIPEFFHFHIVRR